MSEKLHVFARNVDLPQLDWKFIARWISAVAYDQGHLFGELNYIFCDDEEILRVNRQFLQHDYFTDIITFDYTRRKSIKGDIFISLDTVASNAISVGESYDRELLRVIIHGVLHLCGINDKGPGEREIMEACENRALNMFYDMQLSVKQ